MNREQIKQLPVVRRLLPQWHWARALLGHPAVARCAARVRIRRTPLVLFYCDQPSHRQTIHELLVALATRPRGCQLVVLNGFNPEGRTEDLRLPHITELGHVQPVLLRSFRPQLLITPCVGFRRTHLVPSSRLMHLLVSLTSLDGVYYESHFDDYDYIVCAGAHQVDSFREWRVRRAQLADKTLIPGGYPKLDLQLREQETARLPSSDDRTVVYAPTHIHDMNEALASLRQHSREIVRALLQAGWRVIFRPHPVSFSDADRELVAVIVAEHQANPQFSLDRAASYQAAYASSGALVTDLSGTGFTYAFTYSRPVVFYAPNSAAEAGLSGIQFQGRQHIGAVARGIPDLLSALDSFRTRKVDLRQQIERFRSQTIFQLRASGKYLAQAVETILADGHSPDWIRL